jgi:hypothetical protein
MAKGGHRVSMALHPLKVSGSSHVHLGGVGELVPNLHDLESSSEDSQCWRL